MDKTIHGRIGEKIISETIHQYQPYVGEQIATSKNDIRRKFEEEGYNPNEIDFY